MKNFTLLWRSLTVAVFVLFASGMQAQTDCGVNRANISIQVNNTCTELNLVQAPYVTIDFGPGSGNLNGTALINMRPFFLNGLSAADVTTSVEVSFGLATFQLNPSAVFVPNPSNSVQLLDVNFVDIGCSQDFSSGVPVISNTFSMGPNSTLSITDDPNRNIIPSCQGVPTGRLSLRVTPADQNFTQPNRFSVRVLPDTLSTIVSVSPPGTFPNTVPGSNYYIVETNQSLTIGDYTFLLLDNVTNCEVAYDVSLGDPNAQFMVELSSTPVTCFGDNNGSITVDVSQADPNTNGVLSYTILNSSGGFVRNGTLTAPSSAGYNPQTQSNLPADTYSVTLTAGNGGCTSTGSITIGSPAEITGSVGADEICASDAGGTFDIDVTDLMGVFGINNFSNLNYRLIGQGANFCWSSSILTTPFNSGGDYTLTGDVPANCFNASVDRTVPLFLEIYQDGNLTCSEVFPFNLFIKATPPTPEAITYSVVGADSLASRQCSGANIELLIPNYDEDLTYTVTRVNPFPTNVSGAGVFADQSFTYGGDAMTSVTGSIINNRNGNVLIEFEVVATNPAAPLSCDSDPQTVIINVSPAPFLTAFPAGTATDTVCSGQAYASPNVRLNGSNGTTGGNANMRWNYEWDVPADLTYNGGLALSAKGLANNATTGAFAFGNNSGLPQVATLTITPIFPRTAQTLSGTTVADTCFGTPFQVALTVEPVTDLEVVANGTFAGSLNSGFTPSITICSNSDVVFDTDFFGVAGARYKIARILSGAPNVTNGNFGQLAAETRDLNDDFTETLRNNGSAVQTVTYEFRSYTYGPNGVDGGGDDCIGESLKIAVNVLPAINNENIVVVDRRTVNGNTLFNNQSICSFDDFGIELSSSLNSGEFRFEWTRTVSGGDLIGFDANDVSGAVGGMNPVIGQVLATGGNSAVTVTYSIVAVTPGPDGFFGTGDDCDDGDVDVVSVVVEPTPVLGFDLNGSFLAFSGDTIITICSGEDFLIDNLVIPQTASNPGNLKYVEFDFDGDADFLDVVPGDRGVYNINNFQLGTTEVVNTSPDNSFQVAQLEFTPYFEDQNNTTTNFGECEGETITIIVIINPAVPDIMTQDEILCSSEELGTPLIGGTGMGNNLQTILSGEVTFSAENNEFIIPAGANSIGNIFFDVSGANGGASISNSSNTGGVGYQFSGVLNDFFSINNNNPQSQSSAPPVNPGDTVRVVLGTSGADGANAGDGGDASSFIIYGGPNSGQQGSIVYAFVAGGGGGAGANASGGNTSTSEEVSSLGASMIDGARGASFGGFGGLGFPNGFTGGAGVSNGGGGGGGYAGGAGGGNLAAAGGKAGTSLNFGPQYSSFINGSPKNFSADADGAASMSYTIIFDDVNFTLVDKTVAPGLVDLDPSNVTPGTTMGSDTLLYGEAFLNPTNDTLSVVYELTTTTEAGCGEAGTFSYTLIIEPNATGRFVSGGTVVTEVTANEAYEATICSGDSLSALLTSDIMTSGGGNGFVYFFVENIENNGGLTILGNSPERASATLGELGMNQPFGGNNGNAPFPILFFEEGIENLTGEAQTITYTIASRIFNPMEDDCEGTSFTLAVTVLPGFDPANISNPVSTDVCSGDSFSEAGFSIDEDVYAATNSPAVDGIWLLSYDVTPDVAGREAFIDTLSGPDFGGADSILVSVADFEAYRFRNRAGTFVTIDFEVRLAAGTNCVSDVIDLSFISRAEPIIEAPEDNIVRDTICSGDVAGYEVMPAMFSAFASQFDVNNNTVVFYYEADIPVGIDTLSGVDPGDYPATYNVNDVVANDRFQNRTGAPITITYRVAATATNFGCGSDTVTFALVVEPEPMTDLILVSGDSTATYGLSNARLFQPNPEFGVCVGQSLDVSLANTSAASSGGMLMARVIITDVNGLTDFDLNANDTALFVVPVSELGDTLSFASDELVNNTSAPLTFTVSYFTFFDNPNGPNCGGSGVTEFDVTVNPVNTARIDVRVTDANVTTPIPSGMDTLCSGELFDLAVRTSSNTANDPNLPAIDSFLIEINLGGLEAGAGTFSTDTVIKAPFENPGFYFTRLEDYSFINTSAGIKTVTYIATPYSANCAGVPDTTTISYRPEVVLELNEPVVCGNTTVAISVEDGNGQMLSMTNGDFDWRYLGGSAAGFTVAATQNSNPIFVGANANPFNISNQREIFITAQNLSGIAPLTADFQITYTGECGVEVETLTLTFASASNAGTPDQVFTMDPMCDGVNIILNDALIDEDLGGVFSFTNGDPGLGTLNGSNFTPAVGGSDPTPVQIDFTYTVGGGNSGCSVVSTDFSVTVEPAPNAGTLNTMADNEACQAALAFNLFDVIDGAMPGGTFTQTAGVDFVAVASDGVFDQNSITAGTYVFEYEVTSANGCGSDVLTGITVEVLSQLDCSTVVPCDTINLLAGFNVISFDALPADMTVENIFADDISADNLLSIFSINPDTRSSEVYSFNPVFGTTNNTIGNIRDGLGYIVEVDQATQIITCGIAADTSLRVELISSLNIVGYTKPETQTARNYFSTIISNGDVNQIRTVTEAGVFQRLRFNPLNGSNIRMTNSRGYLLDMTADYAPGTWRDDEQAPTSNFDRLFGYTNISEEFAGQYIRFVDAAGNVYGKVAVSADGTYDNMILFGDLAETERLIEGPAAGEELFAEFRGETIATGETFEGNWNLRQLDLNFATTSSPTSTLSEDFKVNVFPNPTAGLVTVNLALDQDYKMVRVEVYNTLGQLVVEREIEGMLSGRHFVELNLEQLAAGTYQVRVFTEAGVKGHQQLIRR